MLNKKNFYINGQWVSPIDSRNYKVIDPSNEEPCAEISLGGKKDVDKAVSAAKKAFETWAFTKKEERLELLEKLYVIYKKRWAEMAKLISLEMGAPIKFSTEMQAATGAGHIKSFKQILKDFKFEKDLGAADLVEERKIEEDRWVFIEGCKHPKSVTLLLRAGSQRVVDEAERSVHDAIMVVKDVMEFPSVVAGGGAPETFAATKIRSWAKSLEGREQLAAEKFAEALESIPLSLSENAGMDPIDTLASLRSKQLNGNKWTGIDVMKGKVLDMKSSDIVEPLAVKNQIISAAAEAACMILRIDDVIATAKSAGPPPGAEGGMPPGMGGMGGMPPGMGGMM